jgi:hypothetical protein
LAVFSDAAGLAKPVHAQYDDDTVSPFRLHD